MPHCQDIVQKVTMRRHLPRRASAPEVLHQRPTAGSGRDRTTAIRPREDLPRSAGLGARRSGASPRTAGHNGPCGRHRSERSHESQNQSQLASRARSRRKAKRQVVIPQLEVPVVAALLHRPSSRGIARYLKYPHPVTTVIVPLVTLHRCAGAGRQAECTELSRLARARLVHATCP